MKKIKCSTCDHSFLVDDDQYEKLSQYKWRHTSRNRFVRTVHENGKVHLVYVHRMIMGIEIGDTRRIDHKDGNPANNQISNLRFATQSQNMMNRRGNRNRKTGNYKGVYREGRKWLAKIQKRNWYKRLGRFDTEEEAAMAYDKAATQLFGEFARLNLPTKKPL